MKLTPKQQAFVHGYIVNGNASASYRSAYNTSRMKPETVSRTAYDLLNNRKIAARIEELQAEARKRHEVTMDSLTKEAFKAIEVAINNGQASAYVSALTLVAKMHGLLTDRQEVKQNTHITGFRLVPDDEPQ